MEIKTTTVSVTGVPVEVLEFVRALAQKDRCSDQSDAGTMRYSLVEHAQANGYEPKDQEAA